MSDEDYWLVQCGTAEEARGDYDHDQMKQQELDDKQENDNEMRS